MNVDFKKLKEEVSKITKAGEIEKILKHDTLYKRIEETALENPDLVAINYLGNKITYRQLMTLIDNAAKGFSSLGVKKNDVVVMSMLSVPYGIVTLYALDKIGATMHMVNCAANKDELVRELSNFKSNLFVGNDIFCSEDTMQALKEQNITKIVTTSLTDALPKGMNVDKAKYKFIEKLKGLDKKKYDNINILNYEQLLELGRKSNFELPACSYEKDHIAAVAYTSGTTGHAKACVATWDAMDSMVQIMGMTEQDRFEKGDVMFNMTPLWIFYSLLNMVHEPLCLGVTLGLDPLFDPKDMVKRNEQYKFNHWLTSPPYIKDSIEKAKRKTDCSKWKIVLTGAEPLKNEVKFAADEFIRKNGGNTQLVQGYGANEGLGSLAYCYYENPSLGSVGKPCVGNFIKIVDPETKKEVGPNQSGIAYIYSPTLMKEYYNDEKSTKEALVKDENGATWYNTGDYIWLNDKGEMFFDDRVKRLVLTKDSQNNPTKISPARVKIAMENMDIIEEGELITIPDNQIINRPIGIIKLKTGIANTVKTQDEIKKYLNTVVPEYMVPKEIKFVDSIPLTSTKKPDIKKLEQMYIDDEFEAVKKTDKLNTKHIFKK